MQLWRFGRGKPRQMSVEDAAKERSASHDRIRATTGSCNKKGQKKLGKIYSSQFHMIPQNNISTPHESTKQHFFPLHVLVFHNDT
jgi:hypothetical protein